MLMLNLVLELAIRNPHHFQATLVSVKAKTFFSIFSNDLSEFIIHADNVPNDIVAMSNILLSNNDIEVYFRLYILLCAE